MTFERYWAMLLKQWKLILGCFLIAGLGTFGVSTIITPVYQSTVVVQIAIHSGSSQSDYNSLLASDQLTQTESQLALSNTVLHEVASHYAGMTIQQLVNEATSTPKTNTQLFEIDVLDPSPTRAAALANDIAAVLIQQQQQLTQQTNTLSRQQIQQDLTTTQGQIVTTTNKIAALETDGTHQAQVEALKVKLDGLQQHFNQWQTVLAQLELTQAQSADFLRVAQPAQPALKPAKPNILFNTGIGLLAGLFLGMLAALLFEQLDVRVHTSEELTQLLGWPTLATVWRIPAAETAERINPQGRDPNVEAYRILRTNIGFSSIDKPLRSLMVTSSTPGDGKSTVVANLAIFMAKAGKNTLLIDADLRRPVQHRLFNLTADKKGLSNAILTFNTPVSANPPSNPQLIPSSSPTQPPFAANSTNFSLEACTHSVGIPNLRVMPSGPLPPNPADLLDSKAMQRLFAALPTWGAEIVIFDAPPLRGLSDASILSSKVDATFLVVDITRANKNHLLQMKTLLAHAGAHVLGCVVNKQRRRRNDTSSYYYYQSDEQSGKGDAASKLTNTFVNAPNTSNAAKEAVSVGLHGGREGGQAKDAK